MARVLTLAQPAHVDITFEGDVPVAVNGVPMPLDELVACVATIFGAHGVEEAVEPLSSARAALPSEQAGGGVVHLQLSHGVQAVVGVTSTRVSHTS